MAEFIHDDNVDFHLRKIQKPMICPEEGSFIGWKCGYYYDKIVNFGYPFRLTPMAIIKLEIPADAKRSSGFGRKCRCNKAKVLSIKNIIGEPIKGAHSFYDNSFIYEVGETVSVPDFCENRWQECAPGIHFFMTEEEAVSYMNVMRGIQ